MIHIWCFPRDYNELPGLEQSRDTACRHPNSTFSPLCTMHCYVALFLTQWHELFTQQCMAPLGRKQKLPDLLRAIFGTGTASLQSYSNGQSQPEFNPDSYCSRPREAGGTILPGTSSLNIRPKSITLRFSPLFFQLARA